MVSVVIYGIIAIALAAAAGYALLVFSSTTQQTTQLQENSVRLEQAANALRASLLALDNDGVLFAPMGYTGGTYTQLPPSLGAVGSSPWGAPFLYCPVVLEQSSLTPNTPATVTSLNGSTYTVGTYSSPSTTLNNAYVITAPTSALPSNLSGAAGFGYVAFIVSSLGSNQPMPNCTDISIDSNTGNVTVTHGSVRGVTAGFPFNQRVIASTDRTEIFVNADTTCSGSGDCTGRDQNNPTTFASAIAMWQALQPRLTDIYLMNGGSYTLNSDLAANNGRPLTSLQTLTEAPNLAFISYPSGTRSTVTVGVAQNSWAPVSFNSVAVVNNANTIWSAYAPLKFISSTYASTTGSVPPLYIYNTDFVAWDSTMSDINLNIDYGSNAWFYMDSGYSGTWSGSQIYLENSKASFTGSGSMSVAPPSPSGGVFYNGLVMYSSQVDVASGTSLTLSNNGSSSFPLYELNGSTFSIPYAALLTLNTTTWGAIIDGASMTVQGSGASTQPAELAVNGVGGYGIYVQGGHLTNIGGLIKIANSNNGIMIDTDGVYDMFGGFLTTTGSPITNAILGWIGGKFNISTGTVDRSNSGGNCFTVASDISPFGYRVSASTTPANNGVSPNNALYLPYAPGSTSVSAPPASTFTPSNATVGLINGNTQVSTGDLSTFVQGYVNNMLVGNVNNGGSSVTSEMILKNIALYNFTCL